jgi:hypothetical protein
MARPSPISASLRRATVPCWLLLGMALCGFGPYRPPGVGAASLGMADAQVASSVGGAALYANPAGMSQVRTTQIDTGFARSGGAGSGALSVNAVDSMSAWGIAGGIGYTRELGWTTDRPRDGHDLRIGMSTGGQGENSRFLLGATARWLSIDRADRGNVSGWTGDVGSVVGLQSLRIGAVLRNAWTLDAREAPRRAAVGVAVVGSQFVAEAAGDWGVANRDQPLAGDGVGQSYRAGLAYQFGEEGLQLRGGYHFDQIVHGDPTRHWVSAGLSWRTTRVAFDLGGAVDAANNHDLQLGASLTLLVPFDSAE